MSQITTTHRGHEIAYSENGDVWRCWAMDLEAPTLSKLKAKINKVIADGAKLGNIAAYAFEGSWSNSIDEVLITALSADKGDRVWIIQPSLRNEGFMQRREVKLDELIPATEEARVAIQVWKSLVAAQEEARKAVKKAREAIPRLTIEYLTGLKSEDADG